MDPQPHPVPSQPGSQNGKPPLHPLDTGAGRIAVHVVARAVAVGGAVGHPPAAHDRVLGAVVGAADRAAELGEARAARAAAATAGVPALADGPVCRARSQREVEPGADGHRAADEGGPVDEAAPRQTALERPGRARHERGRDAHGERDRPGSGAGEPGGARPPGRASAESASEGQPEADRADEEQREPGPRLVSRAGSTTCHAVGRGGGDDRRGAGQHEVEDQVQPAWAACRGGRSSRSVASGPPRQRGVGDHGDEAGVGERDEGRRDRGGAEPGRRAPSAASASAPARTSDRSRARREPGSPGSSAARARAVSSGRSALATPATDEQRRRDQVEADQFQHAASRQGGRTRRAQRERRRGRR